MPGSCVGVYPYNHMILRCNIDLGRTMVMQMHYLESQQTSLSPEKGGGV